jgi:hypothetical protein
MTSGQKPEGHHVGARHDFVTRYSRLTASDEAAVRHRIQTYVRGNVGPERREPLYDSDLATWLLGLLASDTHIEAIEIAERFAKFPCIGAGVKSETKDAQAAFNELFPHLCGPCRFAPRWRRSSAAWPNNDFHVGTITVDQRPHDQVRIHLLLRGDMQSATLTFGPRRNRFTATPGARPNKRSIELDGAVIDDLAELATPDTPIVIAG